MANPSALPKVVGPFSGIDYTRLLETPILGPGLTLETAGKDCPLLIPRDPMQPARSDQHPRIFFTARDIPALRARLNHPTVQKYYRLADALNQPPPPFTPGVRNGGPFRRLPGYALSHILAPSQEKFDGLIAWLKMATTYPHVGADLDAEYFMEGVALTYDWLFNDLPEDLRTDLQALLCRQAQHIYDLSREGKTGGRLHFQQNHYWFAHLSLGFAAAAVYNHVPEAKQWLTWTWDRIERIFLTFSPDGGFHEGPGYWDFSMPALYMLIDLYEQLTGLRVPAADQGLRGQAVFRMHHMYPGLTRTATLEDTTLGKYRPPVSVLLWEAKRYADPIAAGIAEALRGDPAFEAYHLLWLDETVHPAPLSKTVSPSQYYPDIETAFARTGWDENATYLAAVSRPLGGHSWADLCDRYGIGGTGHNHPEQGHFALFGRGEVLAHDPGYTYEKQTRNHNTILIDGQGQYGDGEMWPSPKPGRARITGMIAEGDIAIIAADPSSAYPKELGLARFERTFVLAGRDLVVIYDRLATGQPRTFSWLLHHIGQAKKDGPHWRIVRGQAQLTVAPLQPQAATGELSTYLPIYVHPTRNHTPKEDAEIGLLELKSNAVTETTFLVPLLIGDAGSKIPAVHNLSNNTMHALRVGDIIVAFNRTQGAIAVPKPGGETLTTTVRAAVITPQTTVVLH